MRKTDKKKDNTLRKALTRFCNEHCEPLSGFEWLTHVIDWQRTDNIKVIVVFTTDEQLRSFLGSQMRPQLEAQLMAVLKAEDLAMHNPKKQIVYDTEQQCKVGHNGNWARRLSHL
ncbi:Fis family transcriptional regulator [Pseudoalteromonas sp. MM17-2]|uniref:Fis family transcriptional regulator n=1 Tax=Pseudoalteromonas sp. MM17-2 TaxID=2917753 RepID=UPI001EF45681|nr:Fis family transcriptional regulator [Pseudoalteromonas sp. MM17-2]MCG7545497.1 Fis family transcriptional regulator [Pseudoalteromonas sp. MM17-2]